MATKFRDTIGYNSACVRDICEIFGNCGGVFGNGPSNAIDWILPRPTHVATATKFQTKGAIPRLVYNKYHRRRCGLRVWQLDDVSWSLPQPTLTSRYNEQQRSRSSSCRLVDTSNVLYPTEGILLYLKKVKRKDTDPAIALFTCVRLISRLLAIKQQIFV